MKRGAQRDSRFESLLSPPDSFFHSPLPPFFFNWKNIFTKYPGGKRDRKEYYKITIGPARSIRVSSFTIKLEYTVARRPKWIHGSSIFRPRRKIPNAALNRPTDPPSQPVYKNKRNKKNKEKKWKKSREQGSAEGKDPFERTRKVKLIWGERLSPPVYKNRVSIARNCCVVSTFRYFLEKVEREKRKEENCFFFENKRNEELS